MCRLVIGDGTQKSLRMDNRINILQIQDLKLPDTAKPRKDYQPDERISSALMGIAGAFTLNFLDSKPENLTIGLYDEAWIIKNTQEGQRLINKGARTGRGKYSLLILIGQSIDDLPSEALVNTITYKMCFRVKNDTEAIKALGFFGLEKTEENIKCLTNLGNGQCLFQDMHGRTGFIDIDAIYGDILDAFDTTPREKQMIEEAAILQSYSSCSKYNTSSEECRYCGLPCPKNIKSA